MYREITPRYDKNNIYYLIDGDYEPGTHFAEGYRPFIEEISAYVLNKKLQDVAGSDFVKKSSILSFLYVE